MDPDTPTKLLHGLQLKLNRTDPRPLGRGRGYSRLADAFASLGVAAGSRVTGDNSDGNTFARRVKVNYVPVKELTAIVGIGEAYAARLHELRMAEGNLTPELVEDYFGRRISKSAMSQMDFEPNDMLLDRKSSLPSLQPKSLVRDFDDYSPPYSRDDSMPVLRKGRPEVDRKLFGDRATKQMYMYQSDDGSDCEDEGAVKRDRKVKARHTSDTDVDVVKEDEKPFVKGSTRRAKHQKHISESEDEEVREKSGLRKKVGKKKHKAAKKSPTETEVSDSGSDFSVRKNRKKHHRGVTFDEQTDDDDDDEAIEPLQKMPKGFDKSLRFSASSDGKGDDFDSFKFKFQSYAKAFNWTEEECRYCLCWSLQGPAAKYHTLISSGKGPLTYKQLMKKLEKRFGGEELAETAQARFNQACQEPRESLEMWADRVQMLALKAFRKLPESYATSQAVARFCMGLEDKEAARDASLKRFKTIDEAKDYLHYYCHVASENPKPKSLRRTSSREKEEAVNVFETSINRMQAKINEQLKQMQDKFETQLALNRSENAGARVNAGYGRSRGAQGRGYNNQSQSYGRGGGFTGRGGGSSRPTRGRGWSGRQETGGRGQNAAAGPNDCYFCGETGHIRADCRQWLATQECFACHEFGHRRAACPNRQAQETGQGLNGKGSGVGAKPDP